jgi:hypothetical protein
MSSLQKMVIPAEFEKLCTSRCRDALSHYQREVDVSIKEQTTIGWEHFFWGYISGTWGRISTAPLSSFGQISNADKKKHLDYKRWQKNNLRLKLHRKSLCFNIIAIRAPQTYTLALYGACNDILHNGNKETAAIVNSPLNDDIHQLY